jgi:hypothetical protein
MGLAASAFDGALLLVFPALVPAYAILGAGVAGAAATAVWALSYRYYRNQVEQALEETLALLPAGVRALSLQGARDTDQARLAPARAASGQE